MMTFLQLEHRIDIFSELFKKGVGELTEMETLTL